MAKKITFEDVSSEEFWKRIGKHHNKIFSGRRSAAAGMKLSKRELKRAEQLTRNMNDLFRIYILVKQDGQLIGWHFGVQSSRDTYDMKNTAVIKKYRGQGYYTQILNEVLSRTKKNGFLIVTSRHHGNNASILIPKLRAGFVVAGSELDERFGLLYTMKYFFNSRMRKEFDKSMGNISVGNT